MKMQKVACQDISCFCPQGGDNSSKGGRIPRRQENQEQDRYGKKDEHAYEPNNCPRKTPTRLLQYIVIVAINELQVRASNHREARRVGLSNLFNCWGGIGRQLPSWTRAPPYDIDTLRYTERIVEVDIFLVEPDVCIR